MGKIKSHLASFWFIFLRAVLKNPFPLSEKKDTQLFQQLMLLLPQEEHVSFPANM